MRATHPYPVAGAHAAGACAITLRARLSLLLEDLPFEAVTDALLALLPLAGRLALTRPEWLPTFLVAEAGNGRFGLALDCPVLGDPGPGALRRATVRLAEEAPDPGEGVRYVLWEEAGLVAHAARPTFRLRTEHWRSLAYGILDSLGGALAAEGDGAGAEPASRLLGRVRRGATRNPLAEFARAQSASDLMAFTREVVHGPDPLHLRVAFVAHLGALRRIRAEAAWAVRELDRMMDSLESEVVGDYHLDGQAAVRCLREARWCETQEALEP